MSDVVTVDQLRDLIKTEKVGILDLFSDPDGAVLEMQTRRRVEAEVKAEKIRLEKLKAKEAEQKTDADADPESKYLDPEKNPFIKIS